MPRKADPPGVEHWQHNGYRILPGSCPPPPSQSPRWAPALWIDTKGENTGIFACPEKSMWTSSGNVIPCLQGYQYTGAAVFCTTLPSVYTERLIETFGMLPFVLTKNAALPVVLFLSLLPVYRCSGKMQDIPRRTGGNPFVSRTFYGTLCLSKQSSHLKKSPASRTHARQGAAACGHLPFTCRGSNGCLCLALLFTFLFRRCSHSNSVNLYLIRCLYENIRHAV